MRLDEEEIAQISVDVLVGVEAYAEALVQANLQTSLLAQADSLAQLEVLEKAKMQEEVEMQAETRGKAADDNV